MTTIQLQQNELIYNYWKNTRVLITGGTKGLGKALAVNLNELGAKVAIVARTKEQISELIEKHPSIIGIQADISAKEDIHKISGQALGQLGGIDVLINNASSLGVTPLQPLLETQCEDFSEVLETNLLGPFRLIKAVLPSMLLNKLGVIINISSDAAVSAYETWGAYSISKAALDHLSRIWQEELNGKNIRLLSVDPGDMATDMHLAAIPDANISELYQPQNVATDLIRFVATKSTDQVRLSASQWRELL
ncbi:MAG: SDR family oxidoreductase [Candidatus Kariarchaeaceae archaeon]|jgi:NAD(P)-dependent dehydrogenase (short-subunit alcohol dehydrogenase family)